MPGLLLDKPKPAYKDTKPGVMSINLGPWAIGEKRHIFGQSSQHTMSVETVKQCGGLTIKSSDCSVSSWEGGGLWVHSVGWDVTHCVNIVLLLNYNNTRWERPTTPCVTNSGWSRMTNVRATITRNRLHKGILVCSVRRVLIILFYSIILTIIFSINQFVFKCQKIKKSITISHSPRWCIHIGCFIEPNVQKSLSFISTFP